MGRARSVRSPFSAALTPQLAFARSDETPEVAGITAVRMKITGMLADGPDNLPAHQMQPVTKRWRGARLRNAGR